MIWVPLKSCAPKVIEIRSMLSVNGEIRKLPTRSVVVTLIDRSPRPVTPPRRVIAEIDNRNSANIEVLERKQTRRIVKRIQSGGRHSEGQCQRLGRCIDCRLRRGKIEIHGCRLTCTDQQGAGGGCPEHHCKECRGDPFTCLDQHSLFPQKRHDADKRHLSRYLPCFSATRLI